MSKTPKQPGDGGTNGSFLPTEYVQGKQETRFVAITVSLFVVVMLGVVGAFLVTNSRWTSVRDQQKVIAGQYQAEATKLEQLRQIETQREEMLSKARITTTLLEAAPRSVLLAEIVTGLPEEATLLQAKLVSKRAKRSPTAAAARDAAKAKTGSRSKGKKAANTPPPVVLPPKFEYTLTITGVAPTNNQVADYLRTLQDSPLLQKVELVYIEETKLEDLELRRFEIVAQLPEDADAREVDKAEEFEIDLAVVSDKEDGR